ncbi:MAG TPA: class I SAM-dependent methyltransferase [Terracidiphilus sp.]|nr:class I SAM-dependent methyltransferase [Terracidiphilus sp.]
MDDLNDIQPPSPVERILARTAALNFNMGSETRTGALLRMLAASKPSGRLLELGTGTGIATAWLLDGMDGDSTLTSVDTDPQVQAVAREFLGADRRLSLVTEDGAAFLGRQEAASFDLVFADAMPGKYEALDKALAVVRAGGFYVVDDLLPQPNWPEGHAEKVPILMERLARDERFVIAPMAWASGILVAARKAG